jgi:hypothetical protein
VSVPNPLPGSTSRPVLTAMSILAGLQILTGGAALGDVIGVKVAALAILIVGAAQGGIQFYVQGKVTPNDAVAARALPSGAVVAGPAAPGTTKEGEEVDVLRTGDVTPGTY